MKILQINCVYNKGSTGKIVCDIHEELQQKSIESVVCYGRGKRQREKNVYKTCGEIYAKWQNLFSRFSGLMYGGCVFSTNRLISRIKKEKPDVVHLHCINGYFVNIYRLVEWLKKQNIKTVLTLHAEFMYTANCGHALECESWKTGCGKCTRRRAVTKSLFVDGTHSSWLKMKKAFDGFENLTVVSVSPWLMQRAKQSPILADKSHCVVLNGTDTGIFHRRDTIELREKYGITDEKILFHATPHFTDDPEHFKGGKYILDIAERMKEKRVKIFVAGEYPFGLQVPENVVLLGRVEDQNLLAEFYSMADVTLLTSKRETFSMVCAESFCCGTPIVGFKAGGPEQISLDKYSKFVEYGDIDGMESAIMDFLNVEIDKAGLKKEAEAVYSRDKMFEGYLEIYKR